jgi:hypothetical protein
MSNEPRPTPWWQTLPGLLTAIAAIMTAATGLVVALNQTGLLKRAARPAASETSKVESKSSGPPARASNRVDPAVLPATRFEDEKAMVAFKDGLTLTLDAPKFRSCISSGETIELDGLNRRFADMRSIEVLEADDPYAPKPVAKLRVTFRDGNVLQSKTSAECTLFGYAGSDRSRDFHYNEITRIDFR